MSGTEGTHGNDAWNNGFDEPLETEQLALAGQDERLPWLESPDDEDFAFDRPNTGGLIKLALLGLVLLGGVVGGVWWATHRVTTEEVVADGSLVPAPPGPYKEAPKDPGGKQFAGTGDQTFVVLDGQSSAPQLAGGEVVPAPAAPWSSYLLTAPFAVSLMFTLYAYSGWNAATYILGEVRTPSRVIPAALTAGTLLVMALYLGLNAAFLHVAPTALLAGQLNVAQVAAESVFGANGGRMVAAVIALGLVSAISAMIWAGPRVAMVIGEDYPRTFGWLQVRTASGIPAAAVVTQSALTLVLLLTSTFEQVLVYTQFALLACSFLAVLGVIVYRVKHPEIPRPFRVPLYPLTPLFFLAISAFAMIYTATVKPIEALCGALTLVAGLGIYRLVAPAQKFQV